MGDRLAHLAVPQVGTAHELREIAPLHRVGRALEFDQGEAVQQRQQLGEFARPGFGELPPLAANQQDVHAQRQLADGDLLLDLERRIQARSRASAPTKDATTCGSCPAARRARENRIVERRSWPEYTTTRHVRPVGLWAA